MGGPVVTVYRTLVKCRCGNPIPVRVAHVVMERLNDEPPETVVATYACRRCGIIQITKAEVGYRNRAA